MNQADNPPDIEAEVTFLSLEQGGKTRSVRSGYRPDHSISAKHSTSGHHEYLSHDRVEPGECARAHIWFLAPEIFLHALRPGVEITIQEGVKVVGAAKVLKVINAKLAAEA